jgi:hypothetical protein
MDSMQLDGFSIVSASLHLQNSNPGHLTFLKLIVVMRLSPVSRAPRLETCSKAVTSLPILEFQSARKQFQVNYAAHLICRYRQAPVLPWLPHHEKNQEGSPAYMEALGR